ncbi:DUF2378 family protein [Corallococcus praedator]|uniref:DUF2378 family protein n=1 Tax=Corallococcus praedator TaxID=2316724 RepID=A0ABX9QGN5_9BACT|nr:MULTISPECIES: DUF2378 family protein [Corallococcus]RKH14593.1 DUF2378 family protein [Corallococcus sp. CA047B]RKH28893.1 DUF2378 family protein [Corallococcus sp. CA031C]RKI03199.1 DUF2378 family protein [Corallococcus praedator]
MSPAEVVIQNTLFESLLRCVRLDSSLRERLAAAGYDPDRPRASYPASVFLRCQNLVLATAYAGRLPQEALRQMGRDLVRGFFETLVGKVVNVALKVAGPERAMKRVALSFRSVMEPVEIQSTELAKKDWRVTFQGYPFPAEAAAGCCEEALRQSGAASPTVVLESDTGTGRFELRIRW